MFCVSEKYCIKLKDEVLTTIKNAHDNGSLLNSKNIKRIFINWHEWSTDEDKDEVFNSITYHINNMNNSNLFEFIGSMVFEQKPHEVRLKPLYDNLKTLNVHDTVINRLEKIKSKNGNDAQKAQKYLDRIKNKTIGMSSI